jgi:homoserine kinase
MAHTDSLSLKIPATTANIGPGFDCLGAALTLYNEFRFSLTDQEKTTFEIVGAQPSKISLTDDNLLYQSFLRLYQHLGKTPPSLKITIKVGVPLARGLGSSATAIVAGLLAANHFLNNPCSESELLDLAIALEGHPDNVVPAFWGNCILSVKTEDKWQFVPINCHADLAFILAIPNFELSTEKARAVLPKQLSYESAIYNMSHLALLIRALETANREWLSAALNDQLHQPYRRSLIPGYDLVRKAVLAAGAYGMVISGAGPTLLTLTHHSQSEQVSVAIQRAWQIEGVEANVKSLELDSTGASMIIGKSGFRTNN